MVGQSSGTVTVMDAAGAAARASRQTATAAMTRALSRGGLLRTPVGTGDAPPLRELRGMCGEVQSPEFRGILGPMQSLSPNRRVQFEAADRHLPRRPARWRRG